MPGGSQKIEKIPGLLDLSPWLVGKALQEWIETITRIKRRQILNEPENGFPWAEISCLRRILDDKDSWEGAARAVVNLLNVRRDFTNLIDEISTTKVLAYFLDQRPEWGRVLADEIRCSLVDPVAESIRNSYGMDGVYFHIDGLAYEQAGWGTSLKDYFLYRDDKIFAGINYIRFNLPHPPQLLKWPLPMAYVGTIHFEVMDEVKEIDASGIVQTLIVDDMKGLRRIKNITPPATIIVKNCPKLTAKNIIDRYLS